MKILVRATNWVGDAVLSLPALEAVRGRWPQAEISVLARPWVADLYRSQPCADHVLVFDHQGIHRGMLGRERLARELRGVRFDVALLFQNAFEAAWLAWRAGVPERIGYARDARSALLTRAVPVPHHNEVPRHESVYYLELLRRAGWIERAIPPGEIHLRVDLAARERAESILERAGVRRGALRMAIAPGAAYGTAKCWPPDRFAALADGLIAEFDADVILFGSAAEHATAAHIARSMRHRGISLVGETHISDLPALFSLCDLFIGNDSGSMHVAAAVGVPVVALFGSTDPTRTSPVTPRLSLIQERVSCSPCFLRACPVDHRCMTRVLPDIVLDAARRWIAQSGAARSAGRA